MSSEGFSPFKACLHVAQLSYCIGREEPVEDRSFSDTGLHLSMGGKTHSDSDNSRQAQLSCSFSVPPPSALQEQPNGDAGLC